MTISSKRILESAELSPAAEVIAGIEDLVIGILLHLPVKSLLRFESVSKKWLSLISDPYFARNYVRRHNPNLEPSGLLLNHGYGEFKFVPFNDDGDQARFTLSYPNELGLRISQSCNGLLMCISAFNWMENYKFYICNPTTKQSTNICFPSTEFENDVVAIDLAFDPLKSPHYKLICLRKMAKAVTYQIDIYSSETGSWRPPISGDPLIFTTSWDMTFRAPVYWRGAIHWYSEEETSLYFNTDTECLKTMPMPPFQEGFNYNCVRYFGESRGHLHLIVNNRPSATEFDILELETDYSGWFVVYSVNLDAVMMTFPPDVTWVRNEHTKAFTVWCVVRADREKESTLVLFLNGKAVSFNLHDMTAKNLCDLVPSYKYANLDFATYYEWHDAYQYIETLFNI